MPSYVKHLTSEIVDSLLTDLRIDRRVTVERVNSLLSGERVRELQDKVNAEEVGSAVAEIATGGVGSYRYLMAGSTSVGATKSGSALGVGSGTWRSHSSTGNLWVRIV